MEIGEILSRKLGATPMKTHNFRGMTLIDLIAKYEKGLLEKVPGCVSTCSKGLLEQPIPKHPDPSLE